MLSDHKTAALLYIALYGRGSPVGAARRTGANADYLRNVFRDLENEGYVENPVRGHYVITPAGASVMLDETGLTTTELLAGRLIESDYPDDAMLGTATEVVVRFANDTVVVYDVDARATGVGPGGAEPSLAFDPRTVMTVDEVRQLIDAAFPVL